MNPKAKRALFAIAAVAGAVSIVVGQWDVKDPSLPDAPDVTFKDPGEMTFPATVELEGGKKYPGSLVFGDVVVTVACRAGGETKSAEFKIGDIGSLEIVSWLPRKSKGDRYLFYPGDMKVKLKKGGDLLCAVPKVFWKLALATKNGRKYCYTYFFEYWDKDRWGNSGKSEFSHPMKHPLPGTAVRIVFSGDDELFNFKLFGK